MELWVGSNNINNCFVCRSILVLLKRHMHFIYFLSIYTLLVVIYVLLS